MHYLPYALAAIDARSGAQQLADELAALQPGDIDGPHIARLRLELRALARDQALVRWLIASDPLIDLARNIPAVRDTALQADTLLSAGNDLAMAGNLALNLGDRFAALREASASPGGPSLVSGVVSLMAQSTADVDRLHYLVASASRSLAGIAADAPGPIRSAADLMGGAVSRYEPLLEDYRAIDQILPSILGKGGERRYLILAQDPAELRPTGGYTGTVGIVAFTDGDISERAFQDVYTLDLRPNVPFVEPPAELANHLLGASSWHLADANWSPDFPTSASRALQLYVLESGDSDVAGVVALSTYAVDRLLEVIGPIEVAEYGVTVHPGEVTSTALAQTRGTSGPHSARKAFLDDLASLAMDRVYASPPEDWPALFDAFTDIANQRMLLVWFTDPDAQSLVADGSLGGAVSQDPGDYLNVVEANVAPTSKYNLVVERTDTFEVTLDANGDAVANLRLEWQNNALNPGEPYASLRSYSTSPSGLYGAYVRVLTPRSSQLLGANGLASDAITQPESVGSEAGRSAFGNFLLMPPGQSELTYQWALPGVATRSGTDWIYRLTIQKQPGLRPMPLSATVRLPAGARVISASPGVAIADGLAVMTTTLREDVQLEVRYRVP